MAHPADDIVLFTIHCCPGFLTSFRLSSSRVLLYALEMICSVLLDHIPHIVAPGNRASQLDEDFVHTAKKVFPLMNEKRMNLIEKAGPGATESTLSGLPTLLTTTTTSI